MCDGGGGIRLSAERPTNRGTTVLFGRRFSAITHTRMNAHKHTHTHIHTHTHVFFRALQTKCWWRFKLFLSFSVCCAQVQFDSFLRAVRPWRSRLSVTWGSWDVLTAPWLKPETGMSGTVPVYTEETWRHRTVAQHQSINCEFSYVSINTQRWEVTQSYCVHLLYLYTFLCPGELWHRLRKQ